MKPHTTNRMVSYLRPHAGSIALAVFFMFIHAGFHSISIASLQPFLDDILNTAGNVSTVRIPWIDVELSHPRRVMLGLLAIFVAVAYGIKSFAEFAQNYLMLKVGQRMLQSIRNELFEKYVRLPLGLLTREASGRLISINLNDVGTIQAALVRLVTGSILQPMLILFLMIISFTMAPARLLAVAFIVLPLVGVLIAYFGRKMKRASHGAQLKMEAMTQILQEKIAGLKLVRMFGQEDAETAKFREQTEGYFRWSMKQTRVVSVSSPMMVCLGGVAAAATMYYGGTLVIEGAMTSGQFLTFLVAVISIYRPMKELTNLNNSFQQGKASAERIFKVLDMDEEPDVDAGREAAFEREIRFESVSFRYDGGGGQVLDNLDLSIRKGERVAFVGESGAGKTTVLMLLPKMYRVRHGRLLIDGVDISNISARTLRRLIAMVSQDVILFNDTVSNNIRYGRPDAPRDQIESAARQAQCHEFIRALPQGYETVIGERGQTLSGGQRQRLAIARAFLKDAPILILDEATSNLDAEAEQEVQAAIDRLSAGRTTLAVAHRLATVRDFDRIVLLARGRVDAIGTHQDLLDSSPAYRNLVQLQSL